MQGTPHAQGWHTEKWGTWGWAETFLKLIGIGAGLLAFEGTSSVSELTLANHPHLAAVIVIAVVTLAALATLVIRYTQREIVSMVFAVLNALGHGALLIALLRAPTSTTLPIVFGVFFMLGQVVKIQFLRLSGYTEGGASLQQMQRVAAILGFFYIAFTALLLL